MKRLNHLFIGTMVCIVSQACASVPDETNYSFEVYEENGITIAETIGGPRYEGELFDYVPELTLEPGDTGETMLYEPTLFVGDTEGWFYVYDAGNEDIVVFDPEGRFHHRFGRRGSGPGEYVLVQFLCTVGDVLYLFDSAQLRGMRFKRSGELVDMVSFHQDVSPLAGITALIPLSEGGRLHFSSPGHSGPVTTVGERGSWCSVVRLDTTGDTVWSWQSEPIMNMYISPVTIGRQTRNWRLDYPYSLRPRAYFVPFQGIVAMAAEEPRLDILGLDGRLRRRIRIEMGDLAVTEADRRALIDWYNRIIDNPNEPLDRRVYMEGYRDATRFKERKVPWSALTFDDRGYLFLTQQVSPPGQREREREAGYLVLSPQGEYLGITRPPMGRSRTMTVVGGRQLVHYSDPETGEFTLTVYAMRPLVEGLVYP